MPSLLDTVIGRGFTPGTCAMDKGHDGSNMYAACESRDIRRLIPLKMTVNVANGCTSLRRASTACGPSPGPTPNAVRPSGGAPPAVHPPVGVGQGRPVAYLIPRTTDRWKAIYRTRGTVERGFGRLKHEWGMLPLRVRRLPRVRLHVDLTILAHLACALAKARAVPLAA